MFDFVFSAFSQVIKVFKAVQKSVRNARGVILIEFAICVPILILLLFGLHDIFVMAQMQNKTNFVAHEIVQMIQNVSQGRKDKKITKKDLEYMSRFASYTIYPGKTGRCLLYDCSFYGHFQAMNLFYIKGESDGKASCLWIAYYIPHQPSSPIYIYNGHTIPSVVLSGIANTIESSSIWPTLSINEGEVKMIVEVYNYWFEPNASFLNGTKPSSAKQVFGTYLLEPKCYSGRSAFFNSVAIFTPKRGLFDETPPE